MTKQNNLLRLFNLRDIAKRALQGAGVAFVLVTIIVLSTIRYELGPKIGIPMLTFSFGGACGGVFYAIADQLRQRNGWNKVVVNSICFVVYIISLWFWFIPGLAFVGLWD